MNAQNFKNNFSSKIFKYDEIREPFLLFYTVRSENAHRTSISSEIEDGRELS